MDACGNPVNANGVVFVLGGYAGGVSMLVIDGELRCEYSSLLLKRTKVSVGEIADRRRTDCNGKAHSAVPAELTFWQCF